MVNLVLSRDEMRKINGKPKSNEPTSCQLSSQCVYPIVNACSAALRSKIDSIFLWEDEKEAKEEKEEEEYSRKLFSSSCNSSQYSCSTNIKQNTTRIQSQCYI